MTDQTTANKDLVREFHSGIWAGDFELFDEHVADDYVGHDPDVPGDVHGPEEFRELIAGRQAAMSDIDHTIEDLFGEDDRVVVRGRVTAQHTGEMMGIAPTDEEMSVDETFVYRLEDGKVAETWAAVDRLGMLEQIGAVESPAP
jgi:predicted ester cyclase